VRPTLKPKKSQAPRSLTKPAVSGAKAGKNLRDLVSTVHQGPNGKEKALWKASDSETLKKYGPTREIGGLCLKDFLGNR
jgi:hypothetical protein